MLGIRNGLKALQANTIAAVALFANLEGFVKNIKEWTIMDAQFLRIVINSMSRQVRWGLPI